MALVEGRTELRRAGVGRMTGLCPFHDERTPSFSVNVDDKLFHCFGCGEGGDLFRFVELTENVDFPGAVELLADRAGIQLRTEEENPALAQRRQRDARLLELLDRTSRWFERQLWAGNEAGAARNELRRRGLDPEVLRTFRVGYAPRFGVVDGSRQAGYADEEMLASGIAQPSKRREGDLHDRFRQRITFPLADRRGRIMGFGARAIMPDQKPKYVNSSDGPVYHKGRHLFAAHLARKHAARTGEVILCEGYTDVIALHQAGLQHAVGLMGTALTPEQVQELARLAPSVVLALDADEAGRKAMLRAAELARGSGLELRVVALPDGMDPADLLVRRGTEALANAFAEPMALARFHVGHLLDAADLSTAEAKDRTIATLRPVFAEIPAGVLRMELVGLVAGRLRLDPSILGPLLEQGGAGGPVAGVAGPGGGTAGVGRGGGPGGGTGAPGAAGGAGGGWSGGGRGPGPSGGPGGPGRGPGGGGAPAGGWGGPVTSSFAPSGGGFAPVGPGGFGPGPAGGADDVARAEVAFLAECQAAGAESSGLLDEARIAELFAHEPHRQAAAVLRDALREQRPPQSEDPLVRRVLDGVAEAAGKVRHPSVAAAELAGLRVELGAVTRALRRGGGEAPAHDLVLRRLDLQQRVNHGIGELLKGPRRGA